MNDISKLATADRFLIALKKEHLSKKEAGDSVDLTAAQVSYLFNKHYWDRLGNTGWEKVLAWINSGQSLREYSKKHGKVLPEKQESKSEIDTPDIKSDSVLLKEDKVLKSTLKPEKEKLIKENKQELKRLTNGEMIDLLLVEKASLKEKIEAIDTLLKYYISK